MNNEPVGYVYSVAGEPIKSAKINPEIPNGTPLYTHPANLTDEEIADIISSGEYWELDEHLNIVAVHFDKFARAILRKAQGK